LHDINIGKSLKVWKPDPRRKVFAGSRILDWREELPDQIVIDEFMPKGKSTRGLKWEIYDWLKSYEEFNVQVAQGKYEEINPFPVSTLFR